MLVQAPAVELEGPTIFEEVLNYFENACDRLHWIDLSERLISDYDRDDRLVERRESVKLGGKRMGAAALDRREINLAYCLTSRDSLAYHLCPQRFWETENIGRYRSANPKS
jgi:hypothetical protein